MIIDCYAFVNDTELSLRNIAGAALSDGNENARRGGQARVPYVPAAKCGERTESAQDTANFSYQYADFDS